MQANTGVSAGRLVRLARGVNVSHWLWGFDDALASPSEFEAYFNRIITPDDMMQIRNLGMGHIRLPVDPALLMDEYAPETLRADFLPYLNRALDMALVADLGVIVDVHAQDDFKARLANDDDFADQFVRFWGAFARHLSGWSPEMVYLEVLNEPNFRTHRALYPGGRWTFVQGLALAAMRQAAPQHTLIATSCSWSGLDELVAMTPYHDPNIVYNFHFYEPSIFTHQGADWDWEEWQYFEQIPYPPTPEEINAIMVTLPERSRPFAEEYISQGWNAAVIESRIMPLVEWAQHYGVAVTCNEFGVYRLRAADEDRFAWLGDVRTILERYAIGWSVWDYAGGFSIVVDPNNGRQVDTAAAAALGLLAG